MKLNKKGFTLVELLAVIVVLAIIALIGYTVVGDAIANAQNGADARTIESYKKELQAQCLLLKQNPNVTATDIPSKTIENAKKSFSDKNIATLVADAKVTVTATDCTITIASVTNKNGATCEENTNICFH